MLKAPYDPITITTFSSLPEPSPILSFPPHPSVLFLSFFCKWQILALLPPVHCHDSPYPGLVLEFSKKQQPSQANHVFGILTVRYIVLVYVVPWPAA